MICPKVWPSQCQNPYAVSRSTASGILEQQCTVRNTTLEVELAMTCLDKHPSVSILKLIEQVNQQKLLHSDKPKFLRSSSWNYSEILLQDSPKILITYLLITVTISLMSVLNFCQEKEFLKILLTCQRRSLLHQWDKVSHR